MLKVFDLYVKENIFIYVIDDQLNIRMDNAARELKVVLNTYVENI